MIRTYAHASGSRFISLLTFYSVHTQWFDQVCGCFLGSFPCPSLFLPPCLSTHTYLYLISVLQSPCLAHGSSTALSVVVIWNWCFFRVTGFRLTQWSHKTSGSFSSYLFVHFFSDLLMELMCFPSCPIGTSIRQAVEVFSAGTRRKLLSIGIKRSVTESEDRRGDFTPGRKKILWDSCSFPPPDRVSQNCQY